VSEVDRDQERLTRALEERERIKLAYPDEFADGAKRAFTGDHLYPPGFAAWLLERRNAWFAGFNVGYCDLTRARLEDGDG
jgi:hypothetical protein